MKINELVGYKEKPEYQAFKNAGKTDTENSLINVTSLRDVVKVLNKLGYEQYKIGEGYYSQVYARPQDNYVIKIFRHDPSYMTFLEYIKGNLDNPYVPKLKGKIIRLPNKFSLVRIEKLSPIKYSLYEKLINAAYSYHNMKKGKKLEADKSITMKELDKTYPGLLDFLHKIYEMPEQDSKLGFDLHAGNIMMRGATPVITDPFS